MASSIKVDRWDDEKEKVLQTMKEKHKQNLERAINYMGGKFNDPNTIVDANNNKSFKYFKFTDYTLHYRLPKKYWNEVGLLVPENLSEEELKDERPVHVFFVGGGFWTGDWKYHPWYLQATLRQAEHYRAVILAVNYPRFPLADIRDITQAVDDFWDYFYSNDCKTDIQKHRLGLKLDKNKTMISGESAGGYVAAYSVFRPHRELKVNALFLRYPMLRHYERIDRDNQELAYMGETIQKPEAQEKANEMWQLAQEIRKDMMKHRLLGLSDHGIFADILDRRIPPYGMCGAFTSSWCGTWINYFGQGVDNTLLPDILTQVERESKKQDGGPSLSRIPELFIYHGSQDTNIPAQVSRDFVAVWKKMFKKDAKLAIVEELRTKQKDPEIVPHGFDYTLDENKEPLMKEYMEAIAKAWLGTG